MRPVQFFLVVNLIFFLLINHNLYSLSLDNYVMFKPFTNYNTQNIIKDKLQKTGEKYAEYKQFFNEKITSESKEFVFVFVLFYGLVFYLLFFWKQRFFTGHLAFAAHFISFVLVWNLVSHYFIDLPFYVVSKNNYSQLFDNFASALTCLVVAVYLAIAMRKFYKVHYALSILVSLAAGLTFFSFIQYYRMMLFFKIVNF
jgi:hypothetical protein